MPPEAKQKPKIMYHQAYVYDDNLQSIKTFQNNYTAQEI